MNDDSSDQPPWKVRLQTFSTPTDVAGFTYGNLLYAHYRHGGDSKLARAFIAASLGLEDSREFERWFSRKTNYARGREKILLGGGNQQQVKEFFSLIIPPPFPPRLVANPPSQPPPSPLSTNLNSLTPLSMSLNLPPLTVDHTYSNLSPHSLLSPSTVLSSLNLVSPSSSHLNSTIPPSASVSSKPALSSLPTSLRSPSTLLSSLSQVLPPTFPTSHPSASSFSCPPSSSHSFIPPSPLSSSSHSFIPPTPLSSSSHLSQSPQSKSSRIFIPGATPRGRPSSLRTGMRKKDLPDDIQGVRSFYLGELEEVKGVLSKVRESARKDRKHGNSLQKKLDKAKRLLGTPSGKAAAKSGGTMTQRELAQAQLVKQLRRKIRDLEASAAPVPVSDEVFVTKTRDGFLPQVKYAVLRLAALNVSDSKQGEVMGVVADMLGVRLSHIPAESTIREWIPALNVLNQMHAAELIDQSEGGLTLLRDETTKKGDKIQQHAVNLARDQTLFLGFTAVVDKSALVAFDALRAKVESLSSFSSSSHIFHSFVCKIQNLMSDRASTETLFNKLFASVREAFLQLSEGWDELSAEEKEKSRYLCVHFCQLHSIANLFGVVSSELLAHESESRLHQEDSSSAGFATVLKEVPRYLAVRSAGGHREHKQWKEWTDQVGIYDTTLPSLLGHRFNIQFLIAARIFMLRDSILEFIQYAPNMAFLREPLTNDLVMIQLQILGLLDQKITGPLWRVAENMGVIEAGEYHRDFLVFIDACIDNPARFYSEECPSVSTPPTFELFKVDGTLLKALVSPRPSRLACTVAVRVLRACAAYLREVLSQTLIGGIYCNPSEEVAKCVSSAPTTNRSVESGFALMDYLYRRAPYMRFFRRDAICCFTLNHVAAWLDGKSAEERSTILEKALERRKEIVREERKKTVQLGREIVSKMEADKVEYERKALRDEARKSKITQELGGYGLLISVAKIDCAISALRHTDAINLIKAQLRYRKKYHWQSSSSRLFRFSVGGVNHDLGTLVSNLKELVCGDSISGAIDKDNFHQSYIGRTCLLNSIKFPDGFVLSGAHDVTHIDIDGTVHLQGSTRTISFSLEEFEDFIDDGVIVLL